MCQTRIEGRWVSWVCFGSRPVGGVQGQPREGLGGPSGAWVECLPSLSWRITSSTRWVDRTGGRVLLPKVTRLLAKLG